MRKERTSGVTCTLAWIKAGRRPWPPRAFVACTQVVCILRSASMSKLHSVHAAARVIQRFVRRCAALRAARGLRAAGVAKPAAEDAARLTLAVLRFTATQGERDSDHHAVHSDVSVASAVRRVGAASASFNAALEPVLGTAHASLLSALALGPGAHIGTAVVSYTACVVAAVAVWFAPWLVAAFATSHVPLQNMDSAQTALLRVLVYVAAAVVAVTVGSRCLSTWRVQKWTAINAAVALLTVTGHPRAGQALRNDVRRHLAATQSFHVCLGAVLLALACVLALLTVAPWCGLMAITLVLLDELTRHAASNAAADIRVEAKQLTAAADDVASARTVACVPTLPDAVIGAALRRRRDARAVGFTRLGLLESARGVVLPALPFVVCAWMLAAGGQRGSDANSLRLKSAFFAGTASAETPFEAAASVTLVATAYAALLPCAVAVAARSLGRAVRGLKCVHRSEVVHLFMGKSATTVRADSGSHAPVALSVALGLVVMLVFAVATIVVSSSDGSSRMCPAAVNVSCIGSAAAAGGEPSAANSTWTVAADHLPMFSDAGCVLSVSVQEHLVRCAQHAVQRLGASNTSAAGTTSVTLRAGLGTARRYTSSFALPLVSDPMDPITLTNRAPMQVPAADDSEGRTLFLGCA